MIPILYEASESGFDNNGLGRLRDCISCTVTEERNGVYECDFEYPVDGQNYDLIQIGRIIAVEHDDTNDVQPFDIVSYTRPINGIVQFHAVHISYRQSKMVANGTNINNLADAFTMLSNATPENPFAYETDQDGATGYMAAADGVPKSVRSFLGGVEGSILDTYRGEYEWDKFTVRLLESRGEEKPFTIRYGVDMTDYNEESDLSESYSAVVPYWTSDEATVIGSKVTVGTSPYSGREECVPLDLSDKFEEQPTASELETYAQSYLNSSNATLPAQNITVSFVRLDDSVSNQDLSNLFKCKLCDTVKVEFPRYGMSGRFKIVKTVYNVLLERFDEMELGTLSVSLSEALGIDALGSDINRTSTPEDYVTETGTSSGWRYRKWKNGWVEAWCYYSVGSVAITTSSPGYGGYRSAEISITIPSGIFPGTPGCQVQKAQAQGGWIAHATGRSATQIVVMYGSGTSQTITNQYVYVYAYWYN